MAGLNKLLNVLIFFLSLVALYFSYMLWQQRDQLRDRGDTMAKVVAKASSRLEGLNTSVPVKGKKQEIYLKSNFEGYKNGGKGTVTFYRGGNLSEDDAKPHGLPVAETEATKIYKQELEAQKAGSSKNLKPTTSIPDGGSLSWKSFKADQDKFVQANSNKKDFKFSAWSKNGLNPATPWSKKLGTFLNQVDSVMKQRDFFVKSASNLANELGSTIDGFDKEEYDAEKMATIGTKLEGDAENDTYAPKMKKLEELAKANTARTNALLKTMGELYKKIENTEVEMDLEPFKTLTMEEGKAPSFNIEDSLSEMNSGLTGLRTRMDTTAKKVAEAMEKLVSDEFTMQTTGKDLLRKDPDVYNKALNSFVEDMGAVNGKLEELTKTKSDLRDVQEKLDKVTKERDEFTRLLGNRDKSFAETKSIIKLLQQKLDRLERKLDPAIFKELDTTAQGEITSYNDDYGFVVFNLGVNNDGKYQVVPYIDMLVMRGDRYIGRIRITEVKLGKSIAEVAQVVAGEKIRVGDKIIFKESSGVELEAQYKSEKAKADAKVAAKEAAALEEELGRKEQEEE